MWNYYLKDNHNVFKFLGLKHIFKKKVELNNKIILVRKNKEIDVTSNLSKIKNIPIKITGHDNVIRLFEDDNIAEGISIIINGNSNKIDIHFGFVINSTIRLCSNNSEIIINRSNHIDSLHIHTDVGDRQKLIWGENSTINGGLIFMPAPDAKCIIGNNCMFSWGINILCADAHPIIDVNTGEILNKNLQGVIIGDNCWLAQGVTITKNAILKNNTIVGAQSIVSKEFENEGIIIAGNPARVIKKNVKWQFK